MEISSWKKGKKHSSSGCMIRVSQEEAIEIILSLSSQIHHNNPNRGRQEMYTEQGEYFSMAVAQKPINPTELELDFIYDKIQHNAKKT